MKKISSYLVNYEAPSSGFSEGKLKDNPGDDSGSGITVQTHNDFLYGFYALIGKYLTGGISDADESEINSDVLKALEEMAGLRIPGVSEWNSGTTYSTVGTSVLRRGIQVICINGSGNLDKDPVLFPEYWYCPPNVKELFSLFSSGKPIRGECSPIHDYNNALYQQYFSLGTHKVGGAAGQIFNAYGIHLDGSTVTAAGTLDGILDSYFMQSVFAPGSPKVLKDARETFDRSVGATGGEADTIGERQEDKFQSHDRDLGTVSGTDGVANNGSYATGESSNGNAITIGGLQTADRLITKNFIPNGNGVPRVGSETSPKSFVTGVPYFVVMVPAT